MDTYWISLITGSLILLAAFPYVMRIRHPDQKLFAAYLIFISVFIAVAAVLFSLLVQLANVLHLLDRLDNVLVMLVFLMLVFLPAISMATWLARKPPWRQGPPP